MLFTVHIEHKPGVTIIKRMLGFIKILLIISGKDFSIQILIIYSFRLLVWFDDCSISLRIVESSNMNDFR